MKRELLRARKVAREDAKKSSSALKSTMSGFLKAGSKTLTDPKVERANLVKEKIDTALKYIFESSDDKKDLIVPDYDKMISELVTARHEACSAKDSINELALTFAEGFVSFIASAPEANSKSGVEKHYARTADAMQLLAPARGIERDTKRARIARTTHEDRRHRGVGMYRTRAHAAATEPQGSTLLREVHSVM